MVYGYRSSRAVARNVACAEEMAIRFMLRSFAIHPYCTRGTCEKRSSRCMRCQIDRMLNMDCSEASECKIPECSVTKGRENRMENSPRICETSPKYVKESFEDLKVTLSYRYNRKIMSSLRSVGSYSQLLLTAPAPAPLP